MSNFPYLKTLIEEEKAKNVNTITVLTGDFLAPYLLSSVDKGAGMMTMLRETPIDYVTIGNHEDDLPHDVICKHVRSGGPIWINSNMLDHDAMPSMKDRAVIDVVSKDGTNKRKIGFIGVISDDPALYRDGAFGGATIRDVWDTLKEYQRLLKEEDKCDLVIPLQHTYVPDDYKTCYQFDFPVLLSGHDHHRVDEIVEGTRLLKPGLDAIYATVLEISWDKNDQTKPTIAARFEKVNDGHRKSDTALDALVEEAYRVLAPLRNTELASIPKKFHPLTSKNARGSVTTMGTFICTLLREALSGVDGVILMGGNIRASRDYGDDAFFSLETLESEVKSDEAVGLVKIPGWLLKDGIDATHAGGPIPGWFQYCDGCTASPSGLTGFARAPLDPDRIYTVATKIPDLTNGQSPPLTTYFTDHPDLLPPKGNYFNIHATLMSYFAKNLWLRLWTKFGGDVEETLRRLDLDDDGTISVDEIQHALDDVLGLSVDPTEKSLARFVLNFADTSQDGLLTISDLQRFHNEESSSSSSSLR